MIIHNPILTGSFTVNGTDVASITSSAASITALNSYTASQNILNGTYATTGSNTFKNPQTINSNLIVTGSITAQTLVVQTVSSSVIYSSGSNVFGNNIANTQVFTGSMNVTGSLTVVTTGTEFQVNASGVKMGNVIGDAHSITGSVGISGSLSGTSATFVVSVNNSNTGLDLTNSGSSGYGNSINFYQNATKFGQIFVESSVANTSEMSFKTMVGSTLATRLFISSTGAATFSGVVGANITPLANYGLTVKGLYGIWIQRNSVNDSGIEIYHDGTNSIINTSYQSTGGYGGMLIYTGGYERMRITSGGYTKITNTGNYEYVSAAIHEIRNSAADYILYSTSTHSSNPNGFYISYPNASPNGTGNYFIACADSTAARFRVASNGNCYNVTGTYTSGVSDIRYKEQIVDANSQWNDIKSLRVVNFKFIKDVEENGDNALRQIGFIAQEVEKVSPNLIDEMSDEKTGETWKTIKASIIHTKSIKALQEAMARIEILEAQITELKNK
jgi:hypothetical protein